MDSSPDLRVDVAAAGQTEKADVAGDHAQQEEHEQRCPEQRRDHQKEPLEDVLVHGSSGHSGGTPASNPAIRGRGSAPSSGHFSIQTPERS